MAGHFADDVWVADLEVGVADEGATGKVTGSDGIDGHQLVFASLGVADEDVASDATECEDHHNNGNECPGRESGNGNLQRAHQSCQ